MTIFKRRTKTKPKPQSAIHPVLHPFLDFSCVHWSWDHLTVSSYKMTLSVQPNMGAKDLWALSTYVALKDKTQNQMKNQNESSIKKKKKKKPPYLLYNIIYTRTTDSTGFHSSKYTFFWHSIVLKFKFSTLGYNALLSCENEGYSAQG